MHITLSELAEELGIYKALLATRLDRAERLFKYGKLKKNIKDYIFKKSINHCTGSKACRVINKEDKKAFMALLIKSEESQFRKKIHKNISNLQEIWRDDSIECYNINGQCEKCSIAAAYPFLLSSCKMYEQVKKLLKTIGVPSDVQSA